MPEIAAAALALVAGAAAGAAVGEKEEAWLRKGRDGR